MKNIILTLVLGLGLLAGGYAIANTVSNCPCSPCHCSPCNCK